MALSQVLLGTQTPGTTSVTPPTTGSSLAGDVGYLYVASKRSGSGTQPSPPTDWTELLNVVVSTGSTGSDLGPIRLQIFKRIAATDNLFSSIPAITRSGTNSVLTVITRVWRPGAGEQIQESVVSGSDTSSGTGYSITTGSAPGFAPGDEVDIFTALTDADSSFGAATLTSTGITFASLTERVDASATPGDRLRYVFHSANVSAGTANNNVTFSCTLGASSPGGGSAVMRMRAVPLPTAAPAVISARRTDAARMGALLQL
jgi:hypothetical protein